MKRFIALDEMAPHVRRAVMRWIGSLFHEGLVIEVGNGVLP